MIIRVEIEPSRITNPNMVASATVELQIDEATCGNLRGAVVTIHDCRLLRNKNGIVWFSFPTYSIHHATRQFEYRPTIETGAELTQQITAEAIRAYELWKQRQAVTT